MTARVRRFAEAQAMTEAAWALVTELAQDAVAARGRFSLALSGGTTPLPLYAAMAARGIGIHLDDALFFFGDERLVARESPDSTYGAVGPVLFNRAAIPAANIWPMPVHLVPAEAAAAAYETQVRTALGRPGEAVPRFDLILLGLGPDGHTASLFPGSPVLGETDRLVAAAPPPTTAKPAVARLTFTLPLLNAARRVLFLVAAKSKEQALAKALDGPADPAVPASLVRPEHGVEWFVAEG
jgi:6-phosphogluconolactonase